MSLYSLRELPNKETEYREKVRVAQVLLEGLLRQQQECVHVWSKPVSIRPSDIHSHWSRVCEKCGLLQHATTTKEITQVVPDFQSKELD